MAIVVDCGQCGRRLRARDEFAGRRAECPSCGHVQRIPEAAAEPVLAAVGETRRAPQPAVGHIAEQRRRAQRSEEPAVEVTDFFDPPARTPQRKTEPKTPVVQRMFEALLDPRAIQWLLTLGGVLAVLGLVVWLYSLGLFENTLVVAGLMGAGTLLVLGGGWFVTLKTRYKTAGRALAFLGCVVAPLNLWFYHAQGMVTLDQGLWIGALVCCLLYVATVWVLRDPLFVYAVCAGVTLTVLLILGDLGVISDTTWLSVSLLALGAIAIHAERAFPEGEIEFSRRRFGLPFFWCGQALLAAALLILLGTQITWWLLDPLTERFALQWPGNVLVQQPLLAGGIWLAAAYLYLYSDLVVRRIGIYVYLAAVCVVMGELTIAIDALTAEAAIIMLTLTALAANLVASFIRPRDEKFTRAIPPLAMALGAIPIVMGLILHVRATSELVELLEWDYVTGWMFVAAMLAVAVSNRISAWLYRESSRREEAVYLFFSAGSLILAAAGLLRVLGVNNWSEQAALLMLIPIAYVVASRLWRGQSPEWPLYWVAHSATVVILFGAFLGAVRASAESWEWLARDQDNLLLGVVFIEAMVFYALAGLFHRRHHNAYFAAAAGCAALWQFLGYFDVDAAYYTMIFALLGCGFLAAARVLGLERVSVYNQHGRASVGTRGRGLTAFQCGNAILGIAFLAALLQGLTYLARETLDDADDSAEWTNLTALVLTTLVSLAAIVLAPSGSAWRRVYAISTIALAALTLLVLTVRIDLSGWQKLEIFCVAVGVVLLVVSYVGRFRESDRREQSDNVSLGLWMGGLLATLPLLIAVIWHRTAGAGPSLPDELALLTVSILMLLTGVAWQVKSATLFGGGALGVYLIVLIGWLAYSPQVAVGVYLAIGGAVIFALGVALSMYRERLLALPERFANREGVFRIINWR